MKNLSKLLSMGDGDYYAVALVAVELKGDRRDDEINWDSERRKLVGHNAAFGTMQTFATSDEAECRAVAELDKALAKLQAAGYALVCSPKTIDDEHHNWRRISRIRSPQGKRIALIAYTPWIETHFDPWIY